MIIEHPNVQCQTCKEAHPKRARFDARGRLYVPKPRSLLEQMAEPPCIQSMWRLNGLHWRNTHSYKAKVFIEEWLKDIFIQETPPKIVIEYPHQDWYYYESYAAMLLKQLIRNESRETALHAAEHLFPNDLAIPEQTLHHVVLELWPRFEIHTIIDARGFNPQALEECEKHNLYGNLPQIAVIERLWERHGAPVLFAIIRCIALGSSFPNKPILWNTSNHACYFICQIAKRNEISAAEHLLTIMIQKCQHDNSRSTQAMRELMQTVFGAIDELRPLVNMLKNSQSK